jgi:hypothetical protein
MNEWAFFENLVHVSYLRSASLNGRKLDRRRFVELLPYLRDDDATFTIRGGFMLDLVFAEQDEAVHELSIEDIEVSQPAQLVLSLRSADGRLVYRNVVQLNVGRQSRMWVEVPPGTNAARFGVELYVGSESEAKLWINDLRVQGQTRRMNAYVTRQLRFPRSVPGA